MNDSKLETKSVSNDNNGKMLICPNLVEWSSSCHNKGTDAMMDEFVTKTNFDEKIFEMWSICFSWEYTTSTGSLSLLTRIFLSGWQDALKILVFPTCSIYRITSFISASSPKFCIVLFANAGRICFEQQRTRSLLPYHHFLLLSDKVNIVMAEETKSLESILEKHIPGDELKEVKRMLFGKELELVSCLHNIYSNIFNIFNIF